MGARTTQSNQKGDMRLQSSGNEGGEKNNEKDEGGREREASVITFSFSEKE